MVGGLGSLADGMFTTNLSSHSVAELGGPERDDVEGWELFEESVLLSDFSGEFLGTGSLGLLPADCPLTLLCCSFF